MTVYSNNNTQDQNNRQSLDNGNKVDAKVRQSNDILSKGLNNNRVHLEKTKNDDVFTIMMIVGAMGGLLIVIMMIAVIAKQKLQASKKSGNTGRFTSISAVTQRSRKK